MNIDVTCNACGQKLVGYSGPGGVTLGIDPHTCAPAPEPDVVCNDGVLRVLADGTRQFQNRHGEWENATNKHAFDKALAACVRALRAIEEGRWIDKGKALAEARALGVRV